MTLFNQFLKEIFAERTRVMLTIFAIAWGTMSIALMLAIGEGLRETFNSAMRGMGTNVIFMHGGESATNYHGSLMNQPVNLTLQNYNTLKKAVPEILNSSPEFTINATLQFNKNSFFTQIKAVDPNYAQLRNIVINSPGRFLNNLDNARKRAVIVLGDETASRLFEQQDPLGKTILINNRSFLVVGVMQPKVGFVSNGVSDSLQAWIPTNTYLELSDRQIIDSIIFVLRDPTQRENSKSRIRHVIAQMQHLDPNDENIVNFNDFISVQEKTDDLFFGMEIFLGVVGLLTLIVAGFGIANVMYISVANAQREIGIRMAIGARSYQVLMHYVIEALIVTVIGGLAGFAITLLMIKLFNMLPIPRNMAQYLGHPHPILSLKIVFTVILSLGFIGFAAGFFPARKAAMINPAVALRHE